jgi:PLP dependent protein
LKSDNFTTQSELQAMINQEMHHTIIADCKQYNAKLVAVSKTRSIAEIKALYDAGQRIFGENRVQELLEKNEQLPPDIEWHLIGHLQTNKVKYIASFIHTIHSVDSLKILLEIDKHAKNNNRTIQCLLQFHVAQEESKYGLTINEAEKILQSEEYKTMQHIEIAGIMGMATNTDNTTLIKSEFQQLKSIFDYLKQTYFSDHPFFMEISMGMSSDYKIALQEGSTLVRVGSLLFK